MSYKGFFVGFNRASYCQGQISYAGQEGRFVFGSLTKPPPWLRNLTEGEVLHRNAFAKLVRIREIEVPYRLLVRKESRHAIAVEVNRVKSGAFEPVSPPPLPAFKKRMIFAFSTAGGFSVQNFFACSLRFFDGDS